VLAHRRRQRQIIVLGALALVIGIAVWQVFAFIAGAEGRADAQVQAGIRLMSPGHYPEAISYFDRALRIWPDSWRAFYQRGVANNQLGNTQAAVSDFESALKLHSDLPEAMSALATIYRSRGEHARAIQELDKAIQLRPTTDAYFQRGSTYADLGQHESAIRDFTWVIQHLQEAPWVYLARARSKRAVGDVAGADEDEATAYSFGRKL
jgi:tetratricopeptide (TPR) repeat protein